LLVGGDLTLPYHKSISVDYEAFKIENTSSAFGANAIHAFASSLTGWHSVGVWGESFAPDGMGVYALANSSTGVNTGVRGETASVSGIGVDGYATSTTGPNYAVRGTASSSGGTGVAGYATSATGSNIAILGLTNSNSGYSGFFTGGKFFVNGNVGIGTNTPDFPLVVIAPVPGSTDIASFRDPDNNPLARIRQSSNGAAGLYLYNGVNENTIFLYGEGNSFINSGNLGIGTSTPGYKLAVVGSAAKTDGGSWTVLSDGRLKNLTGNFNKGLVEIAALQPVKFFYKDENPFELPSDQEQIGFIAQDMQKVFPEAVHQGKDGYLDFNMHPVNIALVNAVKELKVENDRLKAENARINERLDKIEALMGFSVKK
jgi:hypothetical protein